MNKLSALGLAALMTGSVLGGGLKFGPGEMSVFAMPDGGEATVVGVSGLNWSSFPKRSYDGLNCFVDKSVVDIEKTSAKDIDNLWCVVFAEADVLSWAGWGKAAGFADEDAIAEYLRKNTRSEYEVAMPSELIFGKLGESYERYHTMVDFGTSFASGLVREFAAADRLAMTVIAIKDCVFDGELRPGFGTYHGVVCCGYTLDKSKPASDPSALTGFFLIESDNDKQNGKGGTTAPDVITYCPAKWTTEPSLGPCYEVTGVMDAKGYFYAETPFDFVRTKDAVKLNKTVNAEGGTGGSSAELVIGAKAETRTAAIVAGGTPVGVLQLKIAKADKKGISKLSGSVVLLDGRKANVKASVDATAPAATVPLKGLGDLALEIGAETLAGTLGEWTVADAAVGGAQEDGVFQFSMTVESVPRLEEAGYLTFLKSSDDPENPTINCLPLGPLVMVEKGKWKLPKAGKITYDAKKDILDVSDVNPSGLKLAYTAKTGVFKGSFNLYSMATGKLKKTSVKVTGYVINGVGYGIATAKGLDAIPVIVVR